MSISDVRKSRGRPKTTGIGTPITLRVHAEQLAEIDQWAAAQEDKPTRPEAVRRLVAKGLGTD